MTSSALSGGQDRVLKLAALMKAYIIVLVASVTVALRAPFKYVLVLSVLCHSLSADSLRAYCSVFYSQTA